MIWRTGLATGVGSLPGEDPLEAARLVLGELPVPHLPELPDRQWYGDLAGRGAALLADLWVDLQPTGWRLVPRPSRFGQRARDLVARDLDAFEQAAEGDAPEVLKLQATGIWTLASLLELNRGDKALSDHGAVTDLAASLAEGVRQHVADVQRRFPTTRLVVQYDEPSLPAVLAARIPTASGFGTLRAPDAQRAREVLRTVLSAHEETVVHCCAARPPVALLVEAGAKALSLDLAMLDPRDDDALGTVLEQGTGLLLGVVPTTTAVPDVRTGVQAVGRLRDRVGVQDVTITPACGLAGTTQEHTRLVLKRVREVAAALEETDDE
jgi:methionine synthase II (cobalamin-independent)